MIGSLFVDGHWVQAEGSGFSSVYPGDGATVWKGGSASHAQVDRAVASAKQAFSKWANASFAEREAVVLRFADLLDEHQQELADAIAKETGKPAWEAKTEAAAMKGKIPLSVKSFHERTDLKENSMPVGESDYSL